MYYSESVPAPTISNLQHIDSVVPNQFMAHRTMVQKQVNDLMRAFRPQTIQGHDHQGGGSESHQQADSSTCTMYIDLRPETQSRESIQR